MGSAGVLSGGPSILGGTKLKLTTQDTDYSGFPAMLEALVLLEKENVAIIGPQFSVTAHLVSNIANELHVPLLSFSATDPALSPLQYPFFVRTTQSDLFQMAAIADIVDYYGWKDVTAVYVDDDYGRNGITALGDKLAEKRCKISYKAPLTPEGSRLEITNALVTVASMESRVIVLHIHDAEGLEVLDIARQLGMMDSEYVWIATDWLSSFLDTNSVLHSEGQDDIQGILTLRTYIPDSEQKRKFVTRWKNNLTVNGSTGLNVYGLYAYDTVWLLANAIDAFFNQGGNISFSKDSKLSDIQGTNLHLDAVSTFTGGNLLLNNILQVNMTGVTGPVKFTSDRNLINPAYEIINVINIGSRRVGYWSNYSGLSVVPPEELYRKPPNRSDASQQLYGVIWPGQTTETPRGWVFANNGKHLKICVPNRTSYPDIISQVKGTDQFTGFCIDIPNINTKLADLLRLIPTGVCDAAVGDFTITTDRIKMVDFTQPYMESGLVVVAPIKKLDSNAWVFLRPFSPLLWCVTGFFFIIVGAIVWLLEHRSNDDFRGPPKRQINTILCSHRWDCSPFQHCSFPMAREKTVSCMGRFVLIIWLFFVLILTSSYTANLTSILTVEQLSSPIKDIQSLIVSNEPIGCERGSFAETYLTDQLQIDRSRLVPLNSVEEYEKALTDGPKRGGVAAVVDERAYMNVFLSTRCQFGMVGQEFTRNGWGFAFPKDSPLAVDMSTAILHLAENGDLQKIHDKWLSKSACSSQGTKQEVDQLQLRSLGGLFVMLGSVCLIAVILYLINLVRQFARRHSNLEEAESAEGRKLSRLRTFFIFFDEKEGVI
ncbi:hypothetical protein Pint_28740 [Pistacia integerrima]|uniref:Uncharacterized protein n=1 Tax=Pistacia integerrima TaxID=434235 RepID=A0ACC0YNJ1_9ROSI|nr:hypothetical protein Pint_28740 [Pistacia integerrima]